MTSHRRPYELRNIKNNPDGYQIQYIVNGKSHSAFDTDLEKAKIIRDEMEKKLKVIPNSAFKTTAKHLKISFIPGTDKPMPAGLSLRVSNRKNTKAYSETYEVAVNWKDFTGKVRIKTFYGCSETRYSHAKMKVAYQSALAFRKAYEQAILDNTLSKLDPSAFNQKAIALKAEAIKEKKPTTTARLRTKARLRNRRR